MKDTVQVAVPIPRDEYYSYSLPAALAEGAEVGKRVLVPFHNRRTIGFIVGFGEPPPDIKLKDVIDIIDDEPLFDEARLGFLKWAADYYLVPLGMMLKAAHPGGLGASIKRTLRLTPTGERAAAGEGRLTAHELTVVKAIMGAGEITSRRLLSVVDNTSAELLNSLKRRGLVEFGYELESDPKIKTERVISAVEGVSADDPALARKRAKMEILSFIIVHGRVPFDELKEVFGNPSAHVSWLAEEGYVTVDHEEVSRDPFAGLDIKRDAPPELTVDQDIACRKISEAVGKGKFAPFLLHGVTGSGKTEVYLRAIAGVLEKGKGVIVLVPEISLTPLLVKRFRARFGDAVAVIHSALSDGERFDAWRRAARGDVGIVIGARSAIFAPFPDLGMIIVDEEHETSYKQDEAPAYNARDLALVLGRMTDSVVVLGSATPSVESYYNAKRHRFGYLQLPLRVSDRSLPAITIVDMKGEGGAILSSTLREAVVDNFWKDRETILFLNRRGYSSIMICKVCGEILKCPNCSVSLTYHARGDVIMCHLCGLVEKPHEACAVCGEAMRGLGIGTQKVEDELRELIPEARIARMDRDAVAGKTRLLDLYRKLERGEIDVLVGTQMVAKGHDLPGVTLVGVISADISLGIPDFRSGERTFQLVTQVAGRAGRGDGEGRAIVQTYNPDHPSITFAARQDSKGFLEQELKLREELGYPPFARLVNIRFTGRREDEVTDVARKAGEAARRLAGKLAPGAVEILGPSPCPVSRIKNRYRRQMLLRSSDVKALRTLVKRLMAGMGKIAGQVRVSADVDPYNFS